MVRLFFFRVSSSSLSDPLLTPGVCEIEGLTCGPNEFACASGDECMPEDYVCDDFGDCADKSDEEPFLDCTVSPSKI